VTFGFVDRRSIRLSYWRSGLSARPEAQDTRELDPAWTDESRSATPAPRGVRNGEGGIRTRDRG
jgi:hypothetical protein